jgi:RNA polymerase sigma-70 factor, ECF subfamily
MTNERDRLAARFEDVRPRLQAVAYGMLGSVSEAEDAVQECWLRLDRSDPDTIGDLRSWLVTVVGRISLDMLRARKTRRTDYVGTWLPEPIVSDAVENGPEHQVEAADTIGLALLVVLESLSPSERLAFVLHDVFALPFDDIARIMNRTSASTRQLASRARRRVQEAPQPDPDLDLQRRVVDAFFAATSAGDFDALVGVLAPNVVMRVDVGPNRPLGAGAAPLVPLVGGENVAHFLHSNAPRFISLAVPVLVNGAPGAMFGTRGRPLSVLGITVTDGRIAALDLIIDPEKLNRLRIEA